MTLTPLAILTWLCTLQCGFFQTIRVSPNAVISFDTSNYKILNDRRGGNFTFYAAKCRGELNLRIAWVILISIQLEWLGKLYIIVHIIIFIVTEYLLDLFNKKNNNSVKFNWIDLGEEWAPFIRNNNDEQYVVENAVSQSCLYTWIGGSSNVGPSLFVASNEYFANYSGTNLIKFIFLHLFLVCYESQSQRIGSFTN